MPIPTRSVVVESLTMFGAIEAHPPPTDAPPPVMEPQDTIPEPSDCNAWLEELQFNIELIARLPPTVTAPDVFKVPATELAVPIPSPPAKYKLPVVVALPEIVSPPVTEPLPIVVEARNILLPVYVPEYVKSCEMVPVVVIVPPVKPLPVATLVTLPLPPPQDEPVETS